MIGSTARAQEDGIRTTRDDGAPRSAPDGHHGADALPDDPEHRAYLRVILGLGVLVLWFLPLSSSFWLDETVTAYVVQEGFWTTIHRAFDFQPMFPTYYVVAWAAKAIAGMHEWVLRFPSVLAMAAATFVVARIGRRLFDAEAGLLAAIVFATSVQGAYMASDARPYALGSLALVVSALLLVRWLDTGDARFGAGSVLAAAAVIYVHYLLGVALLAHAAYLIRRRTVPLRALLAAGVGFLVLLLPIVPSFLDTLHRRSTLSLELTGLGSVATSIAPPSLVAGLFLGAVIAGKGMKIAVPTLRAGRDEFTFLASWALLPPLLLFAASHATGVGVLEPRYVSSALPAICLLAAAGIRMVGPRKARRSIVLIVVAVAVVLTGPFMHQDDAGFPEDWRGASDAVRAAIADPSIPVVVQSGLIEARDVRLLRDPSWIPYLMAPATVYPFGGRLVPAPFGLSLADRAYLEQLTERVLLPIDHFFFVGRADSLSMERWLEGRLELVGFTSSTFGGFGNVMVFEFTRAGVTG
jgi:mannosyltransferase